MWLHAFPFWRNVLICVLPCPSERVTRTLCGLAAESDECEGSCQTSVRDYRLISKKTGDREQDLPLFLLSFVSPAPRQRRKLTALNGNGSNEAQKRLTTFRSYKINLMVGLGGVEVMERGGAGVCVCVCVCVCVLHSFFLDSDSFRTVPHTG